KTRLSPTRQCFLIERDFVKAFSVEEVEATYRDMVEMEIANPPAPEFDVILPGYVVFYEDSGAANADEIAKSIERWQVKISYAAASAEIFVQRFGGDG